jgi:hypothetical protein
MDVDVSLCLFVCADVGPCKREVETVRAPARQGPVRPPWAGERHRREDIDARPAGEERAARRCFFDDPGAIPSQAPPVEAGGDFEDIRHRLEVVL